MLKNRTTLLLLLALLFAGFVFGTAKLFRLRFDRGDIYPPSSSLRSDPLGAKIIYESLREMDSFEVGRLYEPLDKVDSGCGKTLFVLGTGVWSLNWVAKQEVKDIEKFILDGGRFVVSFAPVNSKNWRLRSEEHAQREEAEKKAKEKKGGKIKKEKKDRKKLPLDDEEIELVSLLEKWNLKLDFVDLEAENGVAIPVNVSRSTDSQSLPEILPWHSALCFAVRSNAWQKIYSRDTNAVVIERAFGKGSVVLCSDSYLFSNEAMRKERHPELLAWLVGQNGTVLFDETHLGVNSDPGIAALACRSLRLAKFQ
ncbi:MAG: DUF4350 domain-containing protein [Verrucomicrobiota bacterium]